MNPQLVSWLLPLPLSLALGGAAAAQGIVPDSISRNAFGLSEVAGDLWGGGPGYKIHFGTDAVEFTPALGDRAPRNLPLRLVLESVSRGTARSTAVPVATRTHDDHTVRYARPRFDEVYEVRADGVEQSFVFRELPAGSGDLVVRLAVATELPLVHRAPDEVRFELDNIGGVRIGVVTGIDARGERAAGSLRYANGALELSLPGAWVESAALPLVLDPLIGGSALLLPSDDERPDVAYDVTHDVYLIVWESHMSLTDHDIWGQLVRGNGQRVGNLILIESDPQILAETPCVANVNSSDHFVVAWTTRDPTLRTYSDLGLASVSAATGWIAAKTTIDTRAINVDISGEATLTDDDAVLVWADVLEYRAAQIAVSASGAFTVFDEREIFGLLRPAGQVLGTVRISRSSGSAGRYLVVRSDGEGTSASEPILGLVLDRNLATVSGPFSIVGTASDDVLGVVDGDGERWVVAWGTGSGTVSSMFCRSLSWNPVSRTVSGTPAVFVGRATGIGAAPLDVAWLGGSCLIAYRTSFMRCFVRSVDPFDCGTCEGTTQLPVWSGGFNADVRIGSQLAGGGMRDEALVAWEAYGLPSTGSGGDVRYQRYDAADGITGDLGGGCGNGGTAFATCAVTGNRSFALRLRGAAPAASAALVLSARRLDAPCGNCVLAPDPYAGFVIDGATDSRGHATVPVAIPASAALVGATLFQQWVVGAGSSCGAHDFSNALQVQIQ